MLPIMIDVMAHVSFLLCIGMIVIVIRKCQESQVRTAFIFLLSVMILWSIGTLLELDFRLATGVTYMQFINICYIGICLLPVVILYLGKVILHSYWRIRPVHAAFLFIPLMSIAIVFTDPLHHLFFVNFSLYSSDAVYGVYYYFHSIYSYGCIAAGIILMFNASIRNFGLFSKQSLLVVAGIVVTAIPNVLYSFGVAGLPFSVSAAAFALSILCFAIAFLKFRFITALPITLRQVVDLISDGYLVVDRQQCVLTYNQAFTKLFPDSADISPGTDLRTFVKQCFVDIPYDRFSELQAQAVAQRETISTEANLSEDICVSVEITPVMQRQMHIGSIILFKDITQSKLLIEATKAESRYKSEFLSNMSHEIRTPMNAIIGMVNIGKSTEEIERKNYCFMKIDDASKHLLGVINDVLDMSKIESGKFELSPAIFDFDKTLSQVMDILKYRADEKKQELTMHIDKTIPRILVGDDLRLAQVITNLIGNSVKFTPEHGSISLDTQLVGEENGVCTIQVEVTDTGIGMSSEQQARLFQSFTQVGYDTSRKFGGTGLGLSISKKIIEMMGGNIYVNSEPGKGSSFIFTVQMCRSESEEQEYSGQVTDSEYPGQADQWTGETGTDNTSIFDGYCILLAEDVEINREIVATLLEPTHLMIDCAENGAEAVSMFKASPEKYKMIYMDVQMPEMDGYEATRAIRALDVPQAKTIPIIAMTANVFREDIEKCLESGMNNQIGKPLNFDEVHAQLKQYLLHQNLLGERIIEERRTVSDRRQTTDRRQAPDRRQGDRRSMRS